MTAKREKSPGRPRGTRTADETWMCATLALRLVDRTGAAERLAARAAIEMFTQETEHDDPLKEAEDRARWKKKEDSVMRAMRRLRNGEGHAIEPGPGLQLRAMAYLHDSVPAAAPARELANEQDRAAARARIDLKKLEDSGK